MPGWTQHRGRACILRIDNIDTDQIIPARFMSTPRSAGYADYLLYDVRRDATGALLPGFPVNMDTGATILIAGHNFGTGSSREAAVYALADAGFRAVIAPSFGDIFAANAVNNGVLPARVSTEDIARLAEQATRDATPLDISLKDTSLTCGPLKVPFEISEIWNQKLQNGWDDIDLTLQHAAKIDTFQNQRRSEHAWAWPKTDH